MEDGRLTKGIIEQSVGVISELTEKVQNMKNEEKVPKEKAAYVRVACPSIQALLPQGPTR